MSEPKILTATENREEWLEARRKVITATEVSAILGLHPYETARTVYLKKTGQMPETEQTEAMYLGTKLEPLIAEMHAERHGLDFARDMEQTGFMIAKDNPRHGATPDYIIKPTDTLLECKWAGPNTMRNFGQDGTDDVPQHYLLQVQWQLHCSGKAKAVLTVLTAYGKVKTFAIERDDEIIRRMAFRANLFIGEYLDAEMPPPLSGREPDTDLLKTMYPQDDGRVIAAPYDMEETIALLATKVTEYKELETEVDGYKNKIKEFMGESTRMESDWGRFSWKTSKDSVKTDWQKCYEGLKIYSSLMLATDPGNHALLMAEAERLEAESTVTKTGARPFLMPFKSDKS